MDNTLLNIIKLTSVLTGLSLLFTSLFVPFMISNLISRFRQFKLQRFQGLQIQQAIEKYSDEQLKNTNYYAYRVKTNKASYNPYDSTNDSKTVKSMYFNILITASLSVLQIILTCVSAILFIQIINIQLGNQMYVWTAVILIILLSQLVFGIIFGMFYIFSKPIYINYGHDKVLLAKPVTTQKKGLS